MILLSPFGGVTPGAIWRRRKVLPLCLGLNSCAEFKLFQCHAIVSSSPELWDTYLLCPGDSHFRFENQSASATKAQGGGGECKRERERGERVAWR
nr:hypothetical protein BgiMline_004571 [Biomphalaria glabrata]